MEIKDFIKIYDNAIPLELVSSIVRWSNKSKFEDAGVIASDNPNQINKNVRNTKTLQLSKFSESLTNVHFGQIVSYFLFQHIKKYRHDLKLCDFEINTLNHMAILKYEEGGFYLWHTDHNAKNAPRTISCILLLNDDYEGGELMFMDSNGENQRKVETKAGRLIIWPSNFMFPHKVNTIKKGLRYSIVAWAL